MFIWVITAIALFGTWLNAKQNAYGFLFWMVSNAAFCIWNYQIEQYAQSVLFFVYLWLAIFGYVSWRKKERKVEAA